MYRTGGTVDKPAKGKRDNRERGERHAVRRGLEGSLPAGIKNRQEWDRKLDLAD